MFPSELPQGNSEVFDPGPLLEMSKVSPLVRSKLLGLVSNVVENAPIQLRDARLAWDEGRIEESARLLHRMRGTIGTLGAARFAAAALELESAIRAQHVELIAGLFQAAEKELSEMLAAAASLMQETKSDAKPELRSATGEGAADAGKPGSGSLPKWYADIRADIGNILNDIRKLKDDVKDQAQEQLFEHAVAALPSCLVVEDDELIAHVLIHLLKREGYRVQRCADGRAALEAIEQSERPPGLILLDVMLPYVDGFELIHLIREKKHWSAVPIIMLTAKQHENDIVRALDAGATDYIVKPFQPNELMARLRRILRAKG